MGSGQCKAGHISKDGMSSEQVSYTKSCINNYHSTVNLKYCICKFHKVPHRHKDGIGITPNPYPYIKRLIPLYPDAATKKQMRNAKDRITRKS